MMNLIDKIIAPFSPGKALQRSKDRMVLAAYEAAKNTRTRRNPKDNRSGDSVAGEAAATLRGQARHLDQNPDLARAALDNATQSPQNIALLEKTLSDATDL